ncbi:MAG: signal peptidase II [Candidatus Delongbacteria bacterium]|nr:signal peptidase II [Candidatus Delongbacteria bacterium]MBN2835043.1 signal peptidase II [Candidatus Delongbacteria bacterium]
MKYKYFLISIFAFLTDIFTKFLAKSYFLDENGTLVNGPVQILGDYFRLNFVLNPGIAFGIRIGGQFFLTTLTIVLIIAIVVILLRLKKERKLEHVAFSLILGGALGNLYDRALYGKVVDFFDSDFPDFIMERWPVFNMADSYVTVGMTLLFIQYLILDNIKNKKALD